MIIDGAFPIDRVCSPTIFNLRPQIVEAKKYKNGNKANKALHPFPSFGKFSLSGLLRVL
jgi:hypothetical protein